MDILRWCTLLMLLLVTPVPAERLALTQQQLPLTRRRHFEAELLIKDGETVVLGGLWDAQDTQAAQAIPLLGDLPILGFLFRNSAAHSEPVLMLTPQLMK